MIHKSWAIMFCLIPIVATVLFLWVFDPYTTPHPTATHRAEIRGMKEATLMLGVFYVWLSGLILIMPREKDHSDDLGI